MGISVLVTDGENRSSLAATRSLARSGYRVVVAASESPCIASISRFCSRSYQVPSPLCEAAQYGDAIHSIVAAENIDVLLPMTDQSVHILNQVRKKLPPKIILACLSAKQVSAVADKSALFRLAEHCSVPIPKTLYLSGPGDLPGLIGKIDKYPVVVKPSLSRVPDGNGFISGGVRYAASPAELQHLYSTSEVLRYPSLIQERVIGPGTGLFTLFDRDRHLALFSHQRLREKPPSGGVSVLSQSVELDPEMVEYARRLLSHVEWDGVAMVEFKRDLRDGKPRLMEINGRFWGTLQLAIACGIDFPALLMDKILGNKPVAHLPDYKVGHKLKWFFGTLDHLLIRLRNNDQLIKLPPGSPTRLRSIYDFVKIWQKHTTLDVFDSEDLSPFLLEAKDYLRHTLGVQR